MDSPFSVCGGLLFSAGRPGGLITEMTWKAGKSEVICEWQNRQAILSEKSNILATRSNAHKTSFFYQIMPTGNRTDKLKNEDILQDGGKNKR